MKLPLKNDYEIAQISNACKITETAMIQAAKKLKVHLTEKEVAATIEKEMGAETAFETVVAFGENGQVLHHSPTNKLANTCDLVLIDAGVKYNGFCADMSRTIPISGNFSKYQREVYDWVYKAYQEGLKSAQIGNSIESIHRAVQKTLIQALDHLFGKSRSIILEEVFPHKTSHWIGREVHEKGFYECDGKSVQLQSGMTFTIEPGLYLGNHLPIPDQYKDIHIRLENTIAMNDDGAQELTKGFPLNPNQIEKLMKAKN